MITAEYVRMLARYNSWQSNAVMAAVKTLDPQVLTQNRDVFWGSLMGTMNHLLWGDQMWMSRFDKGPRPEITLAESAELHPTLPSWDADRFRTDGRIRVWAVHLGDLDLKGNLSFYSGAAQRQIEAPISRCVTHFFNHQTHHRGQIHAMLTQIGVKTEDSDLLLMPDDC